VHGDRGVAEHRLRTRGRHLDAELPVGGAYQASVLTTDRREDTGGDGRLVGEWVDEPGQLAGLVLVLHLDVRQGGVAADAPVDQAFPAVDQALLVEGDEHLAHGLGTRTVEGEHLAVPVGGGSELLELVQDLATGGLPPGPHPLEEGLAAELVTVGALGGELPLHHVLGGDPGVVGPRDPHRVAALHPSSADDHVLDRVVQGVTDVQGAGDVGRRDHDREGLAVVVGIGVEQPGGAPVLVERGLDRGGVVGLGQLGHRGRPGGGRDGRCTQDAARA
jgi:hypothetical protein